MKRTWQAAALLVLLLSSGLPAGAAPPAQEGSVSNSFGERGDLYLEWTLSGADMKLREGYSSVYEGTWRGGAIALSGTVTITRGQDVTTWISLAASLGDQRFVWPSDGTTIEVRGRTVSQPFKLVYQVPAGYAETSIPGRIRLDYCGQSCFDHTLTFVISLPTTQAGPGSQPAAPEGQEPPQPTPDCPDKTPEEKLNKIITHYYKRIPKGKAATGPTNNLWADLGFKDFDYDSFKCGGYQASVLKLLDWLRFSTDPCTAALMDDWDYGPIQSLWGGHQAVVLYPRDTEWTQTGLVLDPWIWQIAKVYTVSDWFKVMGYQGVGGSKAYEKQKGSYPTVGGSYTPGGDTGLTEAEHAFVEALPERFRKAFGRLQQTDPAMAKRWLANRMTGPDPLRKVTAHCPLNLYLVGPDGARGGFPGGQPVLELEGVAIRRLPLSDGTYWTEVEYPEGAGYTLVLEGTGSGQAFVLTGDGVTLEPEPSPAYEYAFEVEAGRTYRMSTDSLGQPLTSDGMALQPTMLTQGSEPDWVDRLPSLATIPEVGAGEAASARPLGRWLLVGGGLLVVLVLVVGAALFAGRSRRGTRRAAPPPADVPVTPAPAAAAPGQRLCTACGGPLNPRTKFCGSCGAAVPEAPSHCPHCGQPVNPSARFCGSCGGVLALG